MSKKVLKNNQVTVLNSLLFIMKERKAIFAMENTSFQRRLFLHAYFVAGTFRRKFLPHRDIPVEICPL